MPCTPVKTVPLVIHTLAKMKSHNCFVLTYIGLSKRHCSAFSRKTTNNFFLMYLFSSCMAKMEWTQ